MPVEQPKGDAQSPDIWLSVEQGIYVLIGFLSMFLHLWGLDQRALHHDETLHASYSWNIYTHRGYMHDPLLHGPFLYYFGSLIFLLFGDNDFTARLGYALFGIILTLLPMLVRRELGRPAALLASFYLLISPTFLYVGRFARHDIYSIVFELLVVVAIVRYAASRQARWIYIGVTAFALMYTNQETSYLFLLIIGLPLILLFLWKTFKPGIIIFGVVGIIGATCIFVLPGQPNYESANKARRGPDGRMERATPGPLLGWGPLETADNEYALCIRNRADTAPESHSCTARLYGRSESANSLMVIGRSLAQHTWTLPATILFYASDLWLFFRHPAVLTALITGVVGLAALVFFIWVQRDAAGNTRWQRALARDPHVLPLYADLVVGRRWGVALAIFFLIYVLLFTALLTNLLGVITGTTGSLLYWLAQHHVERGSQPTYYYGVILALYEPLLLFWSVVGAGLLGWEGIKYFRSRPAKPMFPLLFPTFLLWWSIAALAIYSWAGEKMPWLTSHVALPMVLLSAWAVQRILGWALDWSRWRLLVAAIGVFFATIGLNYTILSIFVYATERTNVPGLTLVLLTCGLLIMFVVILGINWGWRWALGVFALCLCLAGSFYTIRNTHRVVYQIGDVPREMLIYTQTSPDVRRVVQRLEEISYRQTAGLDMPIIYDNETVWTWYLRNFKNASRSGQQLASTPGDEVMAVVILQENLDRYPENLNKLQGFRMQRFPLRWWFPEDRIYRLPQNWHRQPIEHTSLLGRVLREPVADGTIIWLWKFLIHRDPDAALGSTDFVLAVRPSIASQIGPGIGARLQGATP